MRLKACINLSIFSFSFFFMSLTGIIERKMLRRVSWRIYKHNSSFEVFATLTPKTVKEEEIRKEEGEIMRKRARIQGARRNVLSFFYFFLFLRNWRPREMGRSVSRMVIIRGFFFTDRNESLMPTNKDKNTIITKKLIRTDWEVHRHK